jgi:hypothetical protein
MLKNLASAWTNSTQRKEDLKDAQVQLLADQVALDIRKEEMDREREKLQVAMAEVHGYQRTLQDDRERLNNGGLKRAQDQYDLLESQQDAKRFKALLNRKAEDLQKASDDHNAYVMQVKKTHEEHDKLHKNTEERLQALIEDAKKPSVVQLEDFNHGNSNYEEMCAFLEKNHQTGKLMFAKKANAWPAVNGLTQYEYCAIMCAGIKTLEKDHNSAVKRAAKNADAPPPAKKAPAKKNIAKKNIAKKKKPPADEDANEDANEEAGESAPKKKKKKIAKPPLNESPPND